MASYTIEDIELIRKKSGISYQEAVALLDYHNGNVARALVDLERNGRIHPENAEKKAEPKRHASRNKSGFANLMNRLYQFRFKVKKGDTTILNLSALFSILAVIISPHTVIAGMIISLIMGYKFSFDKRDEAFASENLEKMVKNAAQNVKESVSSVAKEFTGDQDEEKQTKTEEKAPERSYYQSNPAATTYHASYTPAADVPTIQVPVQVESRDGNVKVDTDDDGATSATIE